MHEAGSLNFHATKRVNPTWQPCLRNVHSVAHRPFATTDPREEFYLSDSYQQVQALWIEGLLVR